MSPGAEPVLAAAGLTKAFGRGGRRVTALDGVDLEAPAGGVTGLVGPDGAGKTTFMRLAAGLLVPDAGAVRVLGRDATGESLAVQAAVGYMPQRFGLYEDLSVAENLDLYADLQGVPAEARGARYDELLHMTGLGDFTGRLAGRLSGGMKQKLGLACTLVRPPRLLLLDEPTVGVDPVSRRELWRIVRRLVGEAGMTVLVSTAYLDEAERCDRVVLLHEGRTLGAGSPESFRDEVRGRTFSVPARGVERRALQARLAAAPAVVDAVIQGDGVRVVAAADWSGDPHSLGAGPEGAAPEPVEPRFEDSFVARLRPQAGGGEGPPEASGGRRADAEPVIRVAGAGRRFGDFWAVRDLDFDVLPGEVFGLLGANGAGKTTTFRMLCGLLPASAGRLTVAGVDLRHAAARARARIGYMSQRFSLYGELTVAENLRFFASVYGLAGRRRRARIAWALEALDLGAYRGRDARELSLGYQQRLALACALLHEPEVLFLDEPTSGVDPLARRAFWQRIGALAAEGVTVLVTTHFLEEAEHCDRIAVMAAGRFLALGAPGEIRARARTPENPEPSLEDAFIHLVEEAAAA